MPDLVTPTSETRATLLLCGRFGERRPGLKPLTQGEFHELDRFLDARQLSPGRLIEGGPPLSSLSGLDGNPQADRIPALLDRRGDLEQALGLWARNGIWVLGERDGDYPRRLRQRLVSASPPLLFGAGPREILGQGGICILGSRDSPEPALDFTKRLGARCGEEGLTVISSDMRGVDREAISSALAAGGKVIGVLSDSLEKALAAHRHREALASGRLALVTSFSPDTRFTVANAMRSYKYQYALSDAAVIVETRRKGGIWSGADENRKEGWVPAFVRAGENMSSGNMALLHLGLSPITRRDIRGPEPLGEFFTNHMTRFRKARGDAGAGGGMAERQPLLDIYSFFLAELTVLAAHQPKSEKEIMDCFGLERAQVRKWLDRAVCEGRIEKPTGSDRYIAGRRDR